MARRYTNEELDELAQFVFYKTIWAYIEFYDEKRFNQFRRFAVFVDMEFMIYWKKIGSRHFLFTDITPIKGFTPTADDREILETLKVVLSPKTLDKMIAWYKDCEKRVSKGQLPTAQPSFRD